MVKCRAESIKKLFGYSFIVLDLHFYQYFILTKRVQLILFQLMSENLLKNAINDISMKLARVAPTDRPGRISPIMLARLFRS